MNLNDLQPGSPEWKEEVFRLAYAWSGGPFDQVLSRLAHGLPVLVYLPGTTMDAAARLAQNRLGGKGVCDIVGDYPRTGGIAAVVGGLGTAVTSILDRILSGRSTSLAVFKNLDRLFLDPRHGSLGQPELMHALFALLESTRNTPTLGLADRAFAPLPDAVERAFRDVVYLDEIQPAQVDALWPRPLLDALPDARDRDLLRAHAQHRLRWEDPLHARTILVALGAQRDTSVPALIKSLDQHTRPREFVDPVVAYPGDVKAILGFDPAMLATLRGTVIAPFSACAHPGADPAQWRQRLAELPSGIVLFGPPGTGKTFLGKWIARSIGLPVRVVAGADLRQSAFGQTERNIRVLFEQARRAAPCVLILDDADDLLVDRSRAQGSTASADRAIVNAMLQELGGVGGRSVGVLVILTSNHYRMIDKAATSRMSQWIHVPYPTSPAQIGELISLFARQFRLGIDAEQKQRLVQRFQQPLVREQGATGDPSRASANRFGPREIEQAMQMLRGAATAKGIDAVTPGCIDELMSYYDRLPQGLADAATVPDSSKIQ